MGFGASIVLMATGAVLRWAVTDNLEGVNLATIGLILLVVGIIGLIASLAFWTSWGGFGGTRRTRTSDGRVYEERVDTF
jgi:hypothetical protein